MWAVGAYSISHFTQGISQISIVLKALQNDKETKKYFVHWLTAAAAAATTTTTTAAAEAAAATRTSTAAWKHLNTSAYLVTVAVVVCW